MEQPLDSRLLRLSLNKPTMGRRSVGQSQHTPSPTPQEERVLREVLAALRSVAHGTITLVVQDHRVVQIDRTDKRRLTS